MDESSFFQGNTLVAWSGIVCRILETSYIDRCTFLLLSTLRKLCDLLPLSDSTHQGYFVTLISK